MNIMFRDGKFELPRDTEMTPTLLANLISKHKAIEHPRDKILEDLYKGKHQILKQKKKAMYKPDNRLVVNFAKYITDTFNGYFMGAPVQIKHPEERVQEYLNRLNAYNYLTSEQMELSKLCDIYGHAYELLFIDENSQVGITWVKPQQAFVVYDDSILHRPIFGVRYYQSNDGNLEGSFSDNQNVYYFNSEYKVYDITPHVFGEVPLIEYVENEERMGIFESVTTLIDAYDKTLSEKLNDVEYFADAYMKVIGKRIERDDLKQLRDDRIINLWGSNLDKLDVDFMQKPNGDSTQENALDRLEKLIFHISMVANINDENFGNTSGESIKFKLQSMSNLANTKEEKFKESMSKRYRMISRVPTPEMGENDWLKIEYFFTRNIPNLYSEEASTAATLTGITSRRTQLSTLSFVNNVDDEMEQIKKENEEELLDEDFKRGEEE